jgi:hypothetical protein
MTSECIAEYRIAEAIAKAKEAFRDNRLETYVPLQHAAGHGEGTVHQTSWGPQMKR